MKRYVIYGQRPGGAKWQLFTGTAEECADAMKHLVGLFGWPPDALWFQEVR